MKLILRAIIWFLVVMFVAFAAVQYNDPDPWIWISVYMAAAIMGLAAMHSKLNKYVYVIMALICTVWAVFQWPAQWEGLGESMLNENTEHAREALGLCICAAASIFYFVAVYAKQKTIAR